jgi:hypothetical protein
MLKATLAILLICLFASQEVFAAKVKLVSVERVKEHSKIAPKPKIELCGFCVSFYCKDNRIWLTDDLFYR